MMAGKDFITDSATLMLPCQPLLDLEVNKPASEHVRQAAAAQKLT